MPSTGANLDAAARNEDEDEEGRPNERTRPAAAAVPKEPTGPLYVHGVRPEHVRKTRKPKEVQKGLEAAFRKRQNIKLKQNHAEVMAALRRVLEQECPEEASLRELFRETSEQLTALGLALGGSEDWADRLYIEDKKGSTLVRTPELELGVDWPMCSTAPLRLADGAWRASLTRPLLAPCPVCAQFNEEELDVAEKAQKRMELMYNVDAWSTQLVVRVGSGQLLLTPSLDGTREDIFLRLLKRIEDNVRYYSELFDEPTSVRILTRIEEMGLPNTLRAMGAQLLDHCESLLVLAMPMLQAMATSVVEQRMKAVRAVAAHKTVTLIERVRSTLTPLRPAAARARQQLGTRLEELFTLLDECSQEVTPHLPQQGGGSDDEDYF